MSCLPASRAVRWALLAAASGCGKPDWDFERMRSQHRADPYEASGLFADGKAMREPPPGTVAWGSTRADSVRTGQRQGRFLARVPLREDSALLERGAREYATFCRACHGAAGFGGSLVAANLVPTRDFSLRTDATRARPAGYVFAVISEGVGRMPSLAWQLDPEARWAVVAYLRRLLAAPATDSAALADSALATEHAEIDRRWLEHLARQARQRDSLPRRP